MNPLRTKQIKRHVLQVLAWAGTYAVPEAALRPDVSALVHPPIEETEWQEAITDLTTGDPLIRQIPDELDPKLIQWAITARGKTVLATL